MNEFFKIKNAIDEFINAKEKLQNLDVLRSERLTGEFGEWFAEQLTGAKRADKTSQKGWDLESKGIKYQVKTHAKGQNNNARWTDWKYDSKEFDFLIILIFTHKLELKEAYHIPYTETENRVNKKNKQIVLKWDDFKDFKITQFPKSLELFLLKE